MKKIKDTLWLLIVTVLFVVIMVVIFYHRPIKYTEKCDEQNDTTIISTDTTITTDTISIPRGARMP